MKRSVTTFKHAFFLVSVVLSALFLLQESVFAGDLIVLKEKTFTTTPGKKLSIETTTGDIYISRWEKNEVYIKISGNKRAQEKLEYRLRAGKDGVDISVKKESMMQWFNGGIYLKFEVKLPQNYNTSLRTAGGDIQIYDLEGQANLSTSGGDIRLFNLKGNVSASTSGGDIQLKNLQGSSTLSTSGGDISSSNFLGNIHASTSGGDIKLSGKKGRVEASTTGGDIYLDYEEANQGIDLSTTGGDITVKVPADFKAKTDLSTFGGDIKCELSTTKTFKISSGSFQAELNGGGNSIECSTTGGDISLLKR